MSKLYTIYVEAGGSGAPAMYPVYSGTLFQIILSLKSWKATGLEVAIVPGNRLERR